MSYKLCNTHIPLKSNWKRLGYSNKDTNEKLLNNICRARSLLYDYAYNNNFYFYVTLTTNKDLIDRYNLDRLVRYINEKIKWLRRKCQLKLDYILIPEKHENGAWHLHGLFSEDFKHDFYINDNKYLSWLSFDNIGFSNIQLIDNYEAICKYILKYINKDFCERKKGDRLYFCSKGLQRSCKIGDYIVHDMDSYNWDYSGDFGFSSCLDIDQYIEFDLDKYYYCDYGGLL